MNIFDLVVAQEIAAYWENDQTNNQVFHSEKKFPNRKRLDMELKTLKGKRGSTVSLKLSALDAQVVPRGRFAFKEYSAQMPFFKESMYIDEKLRQELNKVIASGNQTYIDSIVMQIFDDQKTLIQAAAVARERMRMQLLTTGQISLQSNGQSYEYDYGLESDQKVTVKKSWSDPTADIIGDIRSWQDARQIKTGVRPTEATCNRETFNYILKNEGIKNTIYSMSNGQAYVTENQANAYLMDALGLTIDINSDVYTGDDGTVTKYIPNDTFTLMPAGPLGNTWFGTTPEESDLMASNAVENVSIVDTGVAVTTKKKWDPVNVETKVSMICMPDFPTADQIVIADVSAD